MFRPVISIVAVAFAAIACSLAVPPAYGQTAAEIVDEVLNLFNNNSNSNNSNSNNRNSNSGNNSNFNSRNRPAVANSVMVIDPNTGFRSDPFPVGTRVNIGGPGTPSQSFRLPASVVVQADGSLGQLGAAVSGNYLVIDNRSPDNIILEFIQPGSTSSTPTNQPTSSPNNRSSVGTGNVEARNISGGRVTVRYTLPAGKTYSYNGQNNTRLSAPLNHGRTDETPGIAENTRVTVDGYIEEFYVPRNAGLLLFIHSNNITSQITSINSLNPSPTPSPNPNPSPTPNPSPNPGSNPAPNPSPNPGPLASVPRNTIPKARTTPLTSAVAQALAQRINKEVKLVLDDFERASERRISALNGELLAAGFPGEGAGEISQAVLDGEPQAVAELFKTHRSGNASASRSLEASHLAIATFRQSFSDLLAKIEAGNPASVMASNFRTLKEQATNLGATGLVDALALAQQDLLIRDTINSAVISSVVNIGGQSTPTGLVTVIHHPWLDGQSTYLGTADIVLTRSRDESIVVSKSQAAAALGLPTSSDTPLPESQLSSAPAGIVISNPSTNQTPLTYTLNTREYSIAPNETQQLAVGTPWQIEFTPGPAGAANKQYSLNAAGTYAFVVKDGEWDLQVQEINIRLNNPANSNTNLRYIIDRASTEVAAGSTVEHKSSAPLLIRFDRGNGSSTATKLLHTKGDYYFALDQEFQWDLFRMPNPDEAAPATDVDDNQLTIMRPSLASLRQGAGTMLFDFTGAEAAPSGGNSLLDALKAAQ